MTLSPLRLEVSALETSPFPLDLALVKQHVAVDGTDTDELLELYARAAILWAEGAMHRTIYRRPHRWVLADFPRDRCQEIRLPRGRTASVESIVYDAGAGSFVTLTGPSSGSPAGTAYQEDLQDEDGGVIRPLTGASWPSVELYGVKPVVINFTAGYTAGAVPADIIHAMLFAISDAFDTRGSADLTVFGKNFETRNLLLSGYNLTRFY